MKQSFATTAPDELPLAAK